jgi:hypothetical protein
VFCDCDFLWRTDVGELLSLADPRYAVMVVQHAYSPVESIKMDGQIQLAYPRKNWSSLMLWNCRHPAHAALPELVNTWTGRRLHGFEWLDNALIGALPERGTGWRGTRAQGWSPRRCIHPRHARHCQVIATRRTQASGTAFAPRSTPARPARPPNRAPGSPRTAARTTR